MLAWIRNQQGRLVSTNSVTESNMAEERASNRGFNLEATLKAIMEKLDHTTQVSETALKLAQDF